MAPMLLSAALGIVAVIAGVIGLKRRQPRGSAITGIVTRSILTVFALGLILFALAFVGAIG